MILGAVSLAGLVSTATWMMVRGPAPDPTGGAVGAADPSAITSPSVAPPTVGGPESSITSCTSDSLGYEVAYPTHLITSNEPADQACRYFDEQAFEASADGELPPTQIRIYTSEESYRSLDRGLANTDGLRRWDMRVDGHRAFLMKMLDVTIDGGGTGTLYAYVIDLNGVALVADAYQNFSERFGSTKRILDQMVASLRFLPVSG